MNSREYHKHFEQEDGSLNWRVENKFREQVFAEWKSILSVGDKLEVIRPNHTGRNNSARFYNQGVCTVVEIKSGSVIFQKEGGRKLIYTAHDFTVDTNDYFRKRCDELLK